MLTSTSFRVASSAVKMSKGTRPNRPLAEEMSSGGSISNYTQHESGENYTVRRLILRRPETVPPSPVTANANRRYTSPLLEQVHIKSKEGGEHVYTNVTSEHLKVRPSRAPRSLVLGFSPPTMFTLPLQSRAGVSGE